MTKIFTKIKGSLLIVAAVSTLSTIPALAQLNYKPSSSVNTNSTYTDLGVTGSVIPTANNDDANSAAQPIGFIFNYNGQSFTEFTLNTNGFIKLGNIPLTIGRVIGWVSHSGANIIAPASGIDLEGAADQVASPTEFRVATTGATGSRITTIQFENLADKYSANTNAPAQFTRINFQVKLREGTNIIEFVYGPWVATSTAQTISQQFTIGLKGTTGGTSNRLLAYKTNAATSWAATTFSQAEAGNIPFHHVKNTVLPNAGRTYRFTPVVLPANDLEILALFVQGKMATMGAADTITALVRNSGTSPVINRPVSLTISGANPFSSIINVTLPAGLDSLISFAPFMPTTVGNTNFVEVNIPSDDDNSNNGKDADIVVTTNTIGYAQYPPTGMKPVFTRAIQPIYPETNRTPTNINSKFLVRFYTPNQINITTVRAYVPGAAFNPLVNTTGMTVYGVVLNSAGVEIARSPDIVITAALADNLVNFILTTPATLSSETYFIGMVQPAQTFNSPSGSPAIFGPMAVQSDDDVRYKTYYSATAPSNTPLEEYIINRFIIEAEFTNVSGIKDLLNENLISVYPNPGSGVFNISAAAMKSINVAMEVRNIQGKIVHSGTGAKENTALDLRKLASGIYMLKVSTDKEVAFKRLVIL